jgi:uncharacterized metal-binding protein
MATESTEEHGKIKALQAIFSCSSVGSVADIFYQARILMFALTLYKD